VSCCRGCVPWWRRRMPRTRSCGRSLTRSWSGSCGWRSWSAGSGWTAPIRARRPRRSRSGRENAAARSVRNRSGNAGRTAAGAGSPATRAGLARDPDPGERKDADPPAQCRRCGTGLDGAAPAAPEWAQIVDVQVARTVTEWVLPGLVCPCCGTAAVAAPPSGTHAGSVSYGPALNAAVVLTTYGNVPPERAAHVADTLLGVRVSAGWVDKAGARLSGSWSRPGSRRRCARRWRPSRCWPRMRPR